MDRRTCSHPSLQPCILVIRWCARCSGWGVSRLGAGWGSPSDSASLEVYESHFLPVEETSPDELQHLIQRVFRCAQEWEQDTADLIMYEHGL